ncbi:Protein CSN12 like protein [Dictyocoela muelleri]|nr:Protein CSN12 like protein [Dictyocoela muelleri]
MTIENIINQKIEYNDDQSIAELFKPQSPHILKQCNLSDLKPPFNHLLEIQSKYNSDHQFVHLIEIFKYSLDNLKMDFIKTLRYIIKTVFNKRESNLETVKLFVSYFKELHFKEKYEITVFLLNYIIYLYMKLKNYKMTENLLLVLKDSVIKTLPFYRKDLVFFNFYRGIASFLKDDFKNSYLNIKFSFKYGTEEVRNYLIGFYFYVAFLNGKRINLKYLKKYNLKNLEIFEKIIKGEINPKLSSEFLLKDMRNIFQKYVDDEDIRIYDFIVRSIDVHLPSICFYYILKKIFKDFSDDFKLDMRYVIAYLKIKNFNISYDEIINEIVILITRGYIKAYIALSKSIIVFSKTEPFTLTKGQ